MVLISSLGDFLNTQPNLPEDLRRQASTIPTLVIQREGYNELLWTLRLTEFFGDTCRTFGYQPDTKWTRDGLGALSYRDSAVSSCGEIGGICSCKASTAGDTLNFEITVTNRTGKPWTDCWAWLCLIHRWARAFQANCELPAGSEQKLWMPTNFLVAPMERWLKWCPLIDRQDVAGRIGYNQGTRWQPHIRARQGAVRAWRIEGNQQQFIQLSSPDAIILGWSHWPCTDMGVYFGTLAPDQMGKITGRLEFFEKSFVPI